MSHFPSRKRIALFSVSIFTLVGLLGVIQFAGQPPAGRSMLANSLHGLFGLNDIADYQPSTEAEVSYPEAFGVLPSLKDVKAAPFQTRFDKAEVESDILPKVLVGRQVIQSGDASLQIAPGALDALSNPIANFDGLGTPDNGNTIHPPDTEGDIGYDPLSGKRYYFQWVNIVYKVWDVTNPLAPVVVISTTPGNALWAAALPASQCAADNDGDPIVLFDEQAHRWMISQFSLNNLNGPFHQCIAVSQTADPTGAWNVYDYNYSATLLNDYPHFGVWPDSTYNAYFMTVHDFLAPSFNYAGQAVVAYERAKMLTGDPSPAQVRFSLFGVNPNFGGMLPADLDGAPPANGTPGFFFEVDDNTAGMGPDAMRVWEFKPNWTTPLSSTFGLNLQPNYTMTVSSFNLLPCTTSGLRTCIPQGGTAVKLDGIGDRLMYRAAFRNFGGHQAVVLNHTVWADGTDRAGVRWYEARRNPGTGNWSVYQEGTYAPADSLYRWMGSIAMDKAGNIALGYSASGTASVPSVRYTGRETTDPLNTLPQAEVTMTAGIGSQTSGFNRWGDYSMMGVDPQDGCTFWYTQEYHGPTASVDWRTRIGSFKFPGCEYLSPPPPQTVCQAQNGVFPITVGGAFTVPVTMSVSGNPAPTSALFSLNPVNVVPTTTVLTIGNTGAATPGTYPLVITGTDAVTSSVVNTSLTIQSAIASAPSLTAPADGATDVSVNPTLMWNAVSGADTYDVEVATDAGFSNVIYSASVAGTSHVVSTALAPNITYYWRVRASNTCGDGGYSTAFSFTTVNLIYQTACTSPNLAITDNATFTSTFNIPTGGVLVDVDVAITATHTWVGDLQFTLSNGAASSMVIDRPGYTGTGNGCSANNVGAQLNDEGADGPVESQCSGTPPALFGQPTPNNALSVFDGQSLAGNWSLVVRDNASGDIGTLQQWCVVATLAGTSGPSPSISLEKTVGTDPAVCAASDTVSVGYGDDVTYCYKVTNTGNVSLTAHSLVDDQLGTLLNNFNYTLDPLASAFITSSTQLTASVVNSATWTASSISYTASASDIATVTVVVTPSISVGPTDLASTQGANTVLTQTLTINNSGPGSTLNWTITETPTLPDLTGATAAIGSTAADRAHSAGTIPASVAPEVRLPTPNLPPTPTLAEGFDDISTLAASGWYTQNNSNPLGLTGWFQGNNTVFPAQAGAPTAYIGANFNNTSGAGTISNWLLTPELNLTNGATFVFYTRKTTTDTFPDRLQVRMSTNGASTDVGGTDASVGDFTTLMLDINPTLITGVYPTSWTAYTVTVSGLGGPTTGRLAFRYFVTNGGPSGANSDYIGIDTVSYALPQAGCNAPSDVPWLSVAPSSGSTPGGSASNVSVAFDSTGYAIGVYTGTICINSNDPLNGQVQVPVTMTIVSPTYGVQLDPATQTLSGTTGSVVTYTLTVTNTGNVNDTFDIAITGETFTTTAPASVALAPGASTTFNVVVTIPSSASSGDSATVTLTSQGNGSVSASATITTTLDTRKLYLPIIRR